MFYVFCLPLLQISILVKENMRKIIVLFLIICMINIFFSDPVQIKEILLNLFLVVIGFILVIPMIRGIIGAWKDANK